MSKPKKSVQETVQKNYPEFVAVMDAQGVDELEGSLSRYAKEAESVTDAKEADEGLATAKSQAAELAAPYNDATKAIKLKMRYIISLIKEKGGNA